MKIFVRAKPNARENKIEKIDATHYTVAVTAPPVQGRANAAIIELLAEHFHVSKNALAIVHGHTSRQKTIEIQTAQKLF